MQKEDILKVDELKEDETIVSFADSVKLAFSPEMKCDTLRVVGEVGDTLMVITPEGEILLGKNRLPLDVIVEGFENMVAALKMVRDSYCSHEKDGK